MTSTSALDDLTAMYFDETYYLQNNPAVVQAIRTGVIPSAIDHFERYGQFEGRAPNAWFNEGQYLIDNPDVIAAIAAGVVVSGWAHFVTYGIAEGRDDGTFSGRFDEAAYLAANPDVAVAVQGGAFQNGYEHFLRFGEIEGRPAFNMLGTPLSLVTGQTILLTKDRDAGPGVTGTPENDAFFAGQSAVQSGVATPTWTAGDVVDGNGGRDTFSVIQDAAVVIPLAAVVRNIHTANITTGAAATLDTTAWMGLVTLNTISAGQATLTAAPTTDVSATISALVNANAAVINGGNNVTVIAAGIVPGASILIGNTTQPAGTVSVTDTFGAAGIQGPVTVNGGTTVTVAMIAANPVNTTATMGTVNVIGGAFTTAVTTSASPAATVAARIAGVTDASVSITDINNASLTAAGTITTVAATNFTTLVINDNALTTLSVTGGSGNITIGNGILTRPSNTTLAMTINRETGGSLIDAGVYTALGITTTAFNSNLANISFAALRTLTVAGTRRLTLTSTAGMPALASVLVSGSAGLNADLSGSLVTSIDTTATSGSSTITMNGGVAGFTGGAGVDIVTTSFNITTHAISLGDGNDSFSFGSSSTTPTAAVTGGNGIDSLTMDSTFARSASLNGTFATVVSGFEQLVLTGTTNQTVDLTTLGITGQVSTAGGNGLTLTNFVSGGALVLTGAGTAYTVSSPAFTLGGDDTVNIRLIADNGAAGTNFAATGITATNVENIAITTVDTQVTPDGVHAGSLTILGNSATSITVGGNAGLTLTAALATAATTIDASGILLGDFSFGAGALTSAAAISGSAAGTNLVNFSAANSVTYTGGAGADVITANNASANFVLLGNGTNSYASSFNNAAQSITGGSGSDTVVVGGGANTALLGDGSNTFTASSGNNTYIGGSGVDVVHVGGGANVVTLGAGANLLDLTAATATVGGYTTVLDPTAGDTISFVNRGTETFNSTAVTLSPGALLQQYADAVISAGGNSTTNARLGWFQFGGDTFLVDGQHDGSTAGTFINGIDFIVRLSGLVDLSQATLNGIGGNASLLLG